MTDLNTRRNPFLQSRDKISNQQRFNFIETIKTVVDKDKNYLNHVINICRRFHSKKKKEKKKKKEIESIEQLMKKQTNSAPIP